MKRALVVLYDVKRSGLGCSRADLVGVLRERSGQRAAYATVSRLLRCGLAEASGRSVTLTEAGTRYVMPRWVWWGKKDRSLLDAAAPLLPEVVDPPPSPPPERAPRSHSATVRSKPRRHISWWKKTTKGLRLPAPTAVTGLSALARSRAAVTGLSALALYRATVAGVRPVAPVPSASPWQALRAPRRRPTECPRCHGALELEGTGQWCRRCRALVTDSP